MTNLRRRAALLLLAATALSLAACGGRFPMDLKPGDPFLDIPTHGEDS